MKIAIISQGRSHLINLARTIEKEKLADVVFYTMMPASRCAQFGYNGKVRSFLFPCGIFQVLIDKLPINPYRKSALRFHVRKLFDKLCSVFLKRCDVLIGLNGTAACSTKKAKTKFNAITICDQGSSYIKTQEKVRKSYSNVDIPAEQTNFMISHYDTADYLMTACEYVRNSDIENGIKPERILLNPYGVDIRQFAPTDKPTDGSFDVIMVGAWWKHKGCDKLAKACIDILGVRLLHVGAVIDCELPDSPLFKHVDAVPENELHNYYRQAKVFAMPSLDEGFGLVLLQAASCGLPIVYSSMTGGGEVKRLLNDNAYCLEIPNPLTPDSIAHAISQALVAHSQLPDGLRNQFIANVQNISWSSYAKRYVDIIKSLS